MNKALIVVDMQNDFVTGSLGSPEAQAVVSKVQSKIIEVQSNFGAVVYTRDTHFGDYLNTGEGRKLPVPHCIHGSRGWQIVNDLKPGHACVIDKVTFGYDSWRNVQSIVKADVIELCGVCTDICVVSNALILKALFPEKEIVVDASCCAGTTPDNHKAAIQTMKSCQITIVGEEI